jgi:cytochrome P450
MSASNADAVYWDPYKPEFFKNPYPVFRRLREEAPLYHNEEYGFHALSRYAEVERALKDTQALSSSRGSILEIVKANPKLPEALFIFQDPPIHTAYRALIQRAMTPKRMNGLEEQVRRFCAQCLDPLVGGDRMDFIADLGAKMPMRVISMLLGIPESDQEAIRQSGDDRLRTEAGKPMSFSVEANVSGNAFAEYVEWRTTHPSDDMMTELLYAEFKDPSGTVRRLTREELLGMVDLIAGAGNETTNRLIGWAGKELADHPDQRRDLVNNPALVPQAIEELLRFQTPGPAIARYVAQDVEFYGQTVPKGGAMMLMVGAANRDDRRFTDGEVADDAEAITLMNDSPYGLTASIWTQDIDAAAKIGAKVETGTVFANRCDYLDPALVWTGVKDTGKGGALSEIGYANLTQPKSFHLRHV